MASPSERRLSDAISDGRLCDEYLSDLAYRKRASERTVESYRNDLRRFVEFLSTDRYISVTHASREDIVAFLVECRDLDESPRTRSRRLSSLRGFFSFLKRKGRIESLPTTGLKGAKIPEVLPKVLSHGDISRLLETGRKGTKVRRRAGMLLELMYATGIRVSEAVNLRMEHIVPGENVILIEKGKGGKGRLVVLPPVTWEHLQEYIDGVRPLILGEGFSPWLFPTRSGRALDRQAAWRGIVDLGRAAGLKEEIYPHLLRHTCATHLLENGCDLITVQTLLGHADISTTEIYTHILEERKRKVFEYAHPRARGSGRK